MDQAHEEVHGLGPWGWFMDQGPMFFLFIPNLSCFSSTALCVEMSMGSSMCCMEGLGMF